MKKLKLLCLFAVISNFAVQTWFFEQRTPIKQLPSMALLLLMLILLVVSFILGFSSFSRDRFRAFVSFSICFLGLLISLIAAGALGGTIKTARFEKNLPRFNEVVNLIQNGELKPNPPDRFIVLPPQYSDLTMRATAFASTNSDGTNIEFQTEGGFPVKHSGYLYISSGIMSNSYTLEDWPIHHRINTNWFYVSD
jgi:hypothetical protein